MNNLLIQQYGRYKRQQLDENPYSCLLDTSIDINPHQVDAFCAAVKALKTGGIIFNDISGQSSIGKILRYKGKFLQVYNYTNKDDKMAALHAKILAVDSDDVLISSANLSYHGMSGNIEIGTQVHSEKMVRQINELFKQLLFNKIFTEVNEYE